MILKHFLIILKKKQKNYNMLPQLFKRENDFDKEILQVSNETGIPMYVLKGFIALESGFNPNAYKYEPHRNDASYGLSQILYQTAKFYGFQDKPEKLFDPYLSVKYGALFLKYLFKKYSNIYDIIASYNMGYPRSIKKTTQLIANMYKYPISYKKNPPPGWKYANQPYVNLVGAYIAFYQAKQNKKLDRLQKIYELIRAKKFYEASQMIEQDYLTFSKSNAIIKLWWIIPTSLIIYGLLKGGINEK